MSCAFRAFSFFTVLVVPALLSGQILVREIHVEGAHRLKTPAVIAASGLHLNAPVSAADLDAASHRLFDTGMFTGVNYRYAPVGNGQSVIFTVVEEAAPLHVVLDIPGVAAEQLWAQVLGAASLVDRVIPASPAATEYYLHQIEAVLAKAGSPGHLSALDETDLKTSVPTLVIQPADRPTIADITFEGNTSLSAQAIRDRILRLTVGNPYSERDFRLILDSNIRPMFEEKGLLSVAFRAVRTENAGDRKVSVATAIEEGRVWQLGAVTLEGAELPKEQLLAAGKFASGKMANWKEFTTGLESMEAVLKHDGFLGASARPVRTFQPATGTVDVTVNVAKGKQYHFAALDISGLSDADRAKAVALWKLKAGQPMDELYVDDYIRNVFQTVHPPAKGVSQGMEVVQDTTDVKVAIAFK